MDPNLDPRADSTPIADLAKRLGLSFSNLHLLTRALTHRSFVNENPRVPEDNERLEFLGDAVLDFVVGAWVYHHFPEMAEGELTRLRSALVKTDQLARFARALDLGPALRLGRGELASGGRDRENLLCGAFEAVIGAMYLEAGIAFVERFMQPLLETARADVLTQPDLADAKSRLQEWAQGEKLGSPRYVTVGASGPDHAKQFEVEVRLDGKPLGRGVGSSKAAAEQEAAKAALKTLGLE